MHDYMEEFVRVPTNFFFSRQKKKFRNLMTDSLEKLIMVPTENFFLANKNCET